MIARDRVFTLIELAELLGLEYKAIQKRAHRCGWQAIPLAEHSQRKGFAFGSLPAAVQSEIIRAEDARARANTKCETPARESERAECDEHRAAVWRDYEAAEGWRKRVAATRMDALMMMFRLRDEGVSLRRARNAVVAHYAAQGGKACSVSAIKRWQRATQGKPRCDWMAYLLPERKKARRSCAIHEDAWLVWCRDYLREEEPSAESCYRRLQQQAKANPEWGRLPSLDTFERRMRRDVSPAQIALRRKGEEALIAMGPKIARGRAGLVALERVNSDGHVFDVAVTFPDGNVGRPVIVGWQDIASGKILSWRVGKSETSDLVRLSFCDMVAEFGIPTHAHLDNGRAFASKKNTGGLATRYRYKVKAEDPDGVITRLGTNVQWVTPYNGKAKPIERAWRDFAQDIARRPEFAGAYLGNSPTTKPANYGTRAVPFDEFMRVLAEGVAEHNARTGRRGDGCEGISFNEAFSLSYATTTVKRATQQQLALLLLASEVVKVDGRSAEVRLAGNRYWAECLAQHMGTNIELRFDPEALQSTIHAIALDGTYIGEVPCVAALGWETSDQMREAVKSQAAWRRAHKAERAAAMRAEAAHGAKAALPIQSAPTPAAGVTALFVPKRKPVAPMPSADRNPTDFSDALVDFVFKKQGVKL